MSLQLLNAGLISLGPASILLTQSSCYASLGSVPDILTVPIYVFAYLIMKAVALVILPVQEDMVGTFLSDLSSTFAGLVSIPLFYFLLKSKYMSKISTVDRVYACSLFWTICESLVVFVIGYFMTQNTWLANRAAGTSQAASILIPALYENSKAVLNFVVMLLIANYIKLEKSKGTKIPELDLMIKFGGPIFINAVFLPLLTRRVLRWSPWMLLLMCFIVPFVAIWTTTAFLMKADKVKEQEKVSGDENKKK
eukprot:GHVP01000121.1.p1 GENE.GHVP01000121.1~~GHVP01000121.1.p1  ORF type:complete len:252 (-),score=19.60 GHVP01000121.1:113-868(-)